MSIILFFSHQCNSTVTFVTAMINVLKSNKLHRNTNLSYYSLLCSECRRLRNTPEATSDLGSGKFNRHQTTCSTAFSETQVLSVIETIKKVLFCYTDNMKKTKKNDMTSKMILYNKLEAYLTKNIAGIGPLRATTLISLLSLTGFLPLEYYVNLPIHNSGGPATFMKEKMKLEPANNQQILDWNVNFCQDLQEHFTTEFTPNMLENAACIISRKLVKYDVFYFLPWYCKRIRKFTCSKIQLCFRLVGQQTNSWKLKVFDGIKLHSLLSTETSTDNIFKVHIKSKGDINVVSRNGLKKLYK